MTYEKNEDLIIAVLELLVTLMKGGKKIRVVLAKRKKQTSTTSPDTTNIASDKMDEAEV